jgi:hypothetical protein
MVQDREKVLNKPSRRISKDMKITLPKAEIQQYLDNYIQNTIVDHRRWSVTHEIIFERDGHLYRAYYSVGATEYQDESPWEYEDEVECTEVKETKVIGYEPV